MKVSVPHPAALHRGQGEEEGFPQWVTRAALSRPAGAPELKNLLTLPVRTIWVVTWSGDQPTLCPNPDDHTTGLKFKTGADHHQHGQPIGDSTRVTESSAKAGAPAVNGTCWALCSNENNYCPEVDLLLTQRPPPTTAEAGLLGALGDSPLPENCFPVRHLLSQSGF